MSRKEPPDLWKWNREAAGLIATVPMWFTGLAVFAYFPSRAYAINLLLDFVLIMWWFLSYMHRAGEQRRRRDAIQRKWRLQWKKPN